MEGRENAGRTVRGQYHEPGRKGETESAKGEWEWGGGGGV